MTPKEKAFDLIRLYRNIEFHNGENCYLMISIADAKQCALIAVDEILNIGCIEVPYWFEVKQEIEKL